MEYGINITRQNTIKLWIGSKKSESSKRSKQLKNNWKEPNDPFNGIKNSEKRDTDDNSYGDRVDASSCNSHSTVSPNV